MFSNAELSTLIQEANKYLHIIDAKTDIEIKSLDEINDDKLGNVLYYFIINKQFNFAQQLLTLKPNSNLGWRDNETYNGIIHQYVALEKKPDLNFVKLLCRNNSFVASENKNEETFVSMAAKENLNEITQYALLEDATPDQRILNKFTSRQLARILYYLLKNNQLEFAKKLSQQYPLAQLDTIGFQPQLTLEKLFSIYAWNDFPAKENKDKNTFISLAAKEKRFDIVEYFIKNRKLNQFTDSQLADCLFNLLPEQVKLASLLLILRPGILKSPASTSEKLGEFLYYLMLNNQFDIAKNLIEQRPDAGNNWDSKDNNLLHKLCLGNLPFELTKLIISTNVNPAKENKDNETLLSLAVLQNKFEIVDYIIQYDILNKYKDQQLSKVLAYLIDNKQTSRIKELLDNRISTAFELFKSLNLEQIKKLFQSYKNENLYKYAARENSDKETFLLFLVKNNKWDIAREFVTNKEFLAAHSDAQLGNVLYFLVWYKQSELIFKLLTLRPDTQKTWSQFQTNNTLLHLIALDEKPDIQLFAKIAQDNSAINNKNTDNETVLVLALKKNQFEIVEFLLLNHSKNFSLEDIKLGLQYLIYRQIHPQKLIEILRNIITSQEEFIFHVATLIANQPNSTLESKDDSVLNCKFIANISEQLKPSKDVILKIITTFIESSMTAKEVISRINEITKVMNKIPFFCATGLFKTSHKWKQHAVSPEWMPVIKMAKDKVIELLKNADEALKDDPEIMGFLSEKINGKLDYSTSRTKSSGFFPEAEEKTNNIVSATYLRLN